MALIVGIFRIVKKDEIRQAGETKVLHARVAEDKKSSRRKGEERESNFFDITLFGRRAETFNELLEKGDPVFIQGEIENNNYTNKDGVTVYRDQILVEDFRLIESREIKKVRQRLAERRRAEAWDYGEGIDAAAADDEGTSPKKAAKTTAYPPARKSPAKKNPEPEAYDDYEYDNDDDDFI
ncbi:MAG: single-stranded DNA-binding protein [Eubacteriales bacterium]